MFSPNPSRFHSIVQENVEKHPSFKHIAAFKSVTQAGAQQQLQDVSLNSGI